jgi:hypothetical protein
MESRIDNEFHSDSNGFLVEIVDVQMSADNT